MGVCDVVVSHCPRRDAPAPGGCKLHKAQRDLHRPASDHWARQPHRQGQGLCAGPPAPEGQADAVGVWQGARGTPGSVQPHHHHGAG